MPKLKGKSFLDVGCNAGFFCGEALRQNAKRVVGIDQSSKFIDDAKKRYPQAEFLNQSWDYLPQEKFDVIIMLSALHYEKNPKELLNRIYNHLSDDGLFVLETGVSHEPIKRWIEVPRGVGSVLYPSYDLLINTLLGEFAARQIGKSVDQKGDPLSRYVFHCRKWNPVCVVLSGKSGVGKSNIERRLSNQGCTVISTDALLWRAKNFPIEVSSKVFAEYIKKIHPTQIDKWVNRVKDKVLSDAIADYLLLSLPKEDGIVFVEGYVFENKLIRDSFLKKAKAKKWKIWLANLE